VLHIDVRNFGVNIDCAAQNAMAQAVLKRREDVTTVLLSSLTTPYFEIRKPTDSAPQWAFHLQTTYNTIRGIQQTYTFRVCMTASQVCWLPANVSS